MFDLTHDIEAVNLSLIQKYNYCENIIIYHADYLYENHTTVAKYIFLACSADAFHLNIYQKDQVVTDIIEKIYFELQNDLSWNLYFVCVLEPEEYRKLSLEEILKFQENKEYTRNFIVSSDCFQKQIPIGRTVFDSKIISTENPFEDWFSVLAEDGLTFCLEPYSKESVNDYANGLSITSGNNQYIEDSVVSSGIQKIDQLNLTDKFRPNCFGKTVQLPIKNVNLLSGSNGTGKTSILQAIESVFTGEVRIGNGMLSSEDVSSGISLNYNNGTTLLPSETPQEKKSRESAWYRNRESERTKPRLNC